MDAWPGRDGPWNRGRWRHALRRDTQRAGVCIGESRGHDQEWAVARQASSRPMPDPASHLVERYDREAAAYAELWAPVLRVASLKLLPELAKGHVERVLD